MILLSFISKSIEVLFCPSTPTKLPFPLLEFFKNVEKLNLLDKELIEVLVEFTRTSEELVADEFWEKNYNVLENTVNLIKLTADTIRFFK